MVNLNSQQNITFGHRYRPFYNEVQQAIFRFRDKSIQSHTYWNTVKLSDNTTFITQKGKTLPSTKYLLEALKHYQQIKKNKCSKNF